MLAEKLNGERGLDAENLFSLSDGGGDKDYDLDGVFGSGFDTRDTKNRAGDEFHR